MDYSQQYLPVINLSAMYFTYLIPYSYNAPLALFIVDVGFKHKKHPLHLLQKKALRIITNNDYIAHTDPIYKEVKILKLHDMMPELLNLCNRYELRTPLFRLPLIKHKISEQSLHYCPIKQLNRENGCILTTSKDHPLFLWLQNVYQSKHNTFLQ